MRDKRPEPYRYKSKMVAARWQPLFVEAGLSPADRGSIEPCLWLKSRRCRNLPTPRLER